MKIKNPFPQATQKININQQEIGKMLTLVSLTMLIFSSITLVTLQDINQDLQDVESNYSQINTLIQTQDFQQGIEDLQTEEISDEALSATLILTNALENTSDLSETSQQLEETHEKYQWMILLSILGLIAGITTIYI